MQVPRGYSWANGAEHLRALMGPLALLSRLNRSFAVSFGLTCLSVTAASTVIHIKNHMTYVDVTDMS